MTPQDRAEFTLAYHTFMDILEQGGEPTWQALAKAQADVLLSLPEGERAAAIDLITSTMILTAEQGGEPPHERTTTI